MNTCPDVPEAEATDMVRLLKEACGGNPNMTPEAAGVMLRLIIAELWKIAQQSEEAGNVKQEWGTVGQVAKIYGMKSARADDYLLPWVAAGKVEVITPTDPVTGKKGNKRYNLAQVAACMEAAPNGRKTVLPFPLP